MRGVGEELPLLLLWRLFPSLLERDQYPDFDLHREGIKLSETLITQERRRGTLAEPASPGLGRLR